MEKYCPCCKKTLPVSAFHKDRKKKDGLRTWCKSCVREKFVKNYLGTDSYKSRLKKYYDKRKAQVALDPKPQWVTYAMGNAKQRAKDAGLEYSLTKEDILNVFPDNCPLLGTPFVFAQGRTLAASPSLDRKDPLKGYTPDNVWVISAMANRIKSNATTEQISMVAERLRFHGV